MTCSRNSYQMAAKETVDLVPRRRQKHIERRCKSQGGKKMGGIGGHVKVRVDRRGNTR